MNVNDSMNEGLEKLQGVPSFDYDQAYRQAFEGIGGLGPKFSAYGIAWIAGRTLAYKVWRDRATAIIDLRNARTR